MAEPGFWSKQETAQQAVKETKLLKGLTAPWRDLKSRADDLVELIALAAEEGEDQEGDEIREELTSLEKDVDAWRLRSLMSGEQDDSNCFLYIHPGAGGTESCDWAQMLMRLYLRWAERHGMKAEVVDTLPGEEAGIRSATMLISGDYAYGYLKAEVGVHRLVRISPFDSNKRRHTSFASVFAYPEVDDAITVDINEDDLRVDTYRSSGAGGQHVNVTDSAVRITHLPTGIMVQCQNERSQHKNKAMALKYLRSRLYDHYLQEKLDERAEVNETKKDIAWGSQIRSYVFQPYQMVKDLRTNVEVGNVSAVMDGDIDRFIEAYLEKTVES